MTGEWLLWYRVAFHLGRTVWELKQQITYTEFWDWIVFLDREETRRTKQDYYLAQIATVLKQVNSTTPNKIKLKDSLIDFETPAAEQGDWKARMERSKAAWDSVLKRSWRKRKKE